MAQTMKIRKGDVVHVLRGKDAGKEGRVVEALPKQGRVVVENINVVKRHRRPRAIQNTTGMGGAAMVPGGIIDLPAPLPVSNVMVVCPTCGKPTRVGTIEKTIKDKTVRVRVCKRPGCGQEIDRG
jgi:large subunit ribosomal protein L24